MESHNLENQRSKNYAKTLSQTCQQEVDRILPQDPSGESSLLQNNHSKTKSMSQEYDMGLTLAGISLMFVLCQSVKLIPDIYELMVCDPWKITKDEHDPNCHNPTTIDVITSLGNLCVCINSAINFLLYMVKGKKFRDAFYQTYFSCNQTSRNASASNTVIMNMNSTANNSIYVRKNPRNVK